MLKARMSAEAALFPTLAGRSIRPRGVSENDLCALCLLFVHPLVFIPGGWKGKERPIFIK
jgi:hypothetical protein